jgi:hypothetical protein
MTSTYHAYLKRARPTLLGRQERWRGIVKAYFPGEGWQEIHRTPRVPTSDEAASRATSWIQRRTAKEQRRELIPIKETP